MAIVTGQFERVAEIVAQRAAEILTANAAVVDEHRMIVAGSQGLCPGHYLEHDCDAEGSSCLHIPVSFDAQSGEVIVFGGGGDEVISPRLARVLVELMISQTIVLSRLPHQHELKNQFIHTLLRGNIADDGEIMRDGQLLGMDLTLPRACVLVDASDYILAPAYDASEFAEVESRRRAQVVIASIVSFFALPTDTICAYIGNGEVAVLKASTTRDLQNWLDGTDREHSLEDDGASWANLAALKRAAEGLLSRIHRDTNSAVSIGIGRYHPGIRGLARSYQDALAALSLGMCFSGPNRVHCLDGLGIAAFVGVSDERTKVDLARHLLSPLDHEPELLDTLDAFFAEDCSPSTTASRLSIHRNTLAHRLDRIAALAGLDPRRFDDAVQIRLALLLRAFRPSAA